MVTTKEIKKANNELEIQYFSKTTHDSSYFYKNKKIKYIAKFSGDSMFLKRYDDLGKIESEGLLQNNVKVGKWIFYKNEKIDKVLEYINLCGEQYLNQGWYYDNKGKLLLDKTNYYKILQYKSVLKVGEKVEMKIYYKKLLNTEKEYQENILGFCLAKDTVSDYCNALKNKKINCSYDIKKDTISFILNPEKKGKFYIVGFIRESYKDQKTAATGTRDVFINLPFEVK